jgi:hypothetical protein
MTSAEKERGGGGGGEIERGSGCEGRPVDNCWLLI